MSEQQPNTNPPPDAAAREAMDRLNDKNRILVESRMTGNSKHLSAEKIKSIRDAFIDYVQRNEVPLTAVAKQTDYSLAVISQFHGGNYAGNLTRVARAVNDWLERDARRRENKRPRNYVKTWIAEDIRTVVQLADKRGMMAAIVVPAGAGKTFVLKALCESMRGVYVYCHDKMNARDLLIAVCAQLGKSYKLGSRSEFHRRIVDSLRDTKRIIFLDEAHRLGKALGNVRSIHDEAGVPIIMAGTVEILEAINDRTDGRGQFSSRTIRYNALDQARNAEGSDGSAAGRDLFTIEEVKAFFEMKKMRIDREAMKLLWSLACLPSFGCLRLIEHTTETIYDVDPDIQIVTREHVLAALKMLHGADAVYMERLTERHVELTREAMVA